MGDSQKFNDQLDEIIKRTGAGTEVFNKQMKAKVKKIGLMSLGYVAVGIVASFIFQLLSPNDKVMEVLVGYIRLLSFLMLVFGSICILAVLVQWYVYDNLAKRRTSSDPGR